MSDNIYLGNPNLKKANVAQEFTQEQILEFYACRNDPKHCCGHQVWNGEYHIELYSIVTGVFIAVNMSDINDSYVVGSAVSKTKSGYGV